MSKKRKRSRNGSRRDLKFLRALAKTWDGSSVELEAPIKKPTYSRPVIGYRNLSMEDLLFIAERQKYTDIRWELMCHVQKD